MSLPRKRLSPARLLCTMMFTCPRCRKSFWQRHDFRAVNVLADAMIAEGRPTEALAFAREEIQRHA